MPVRLPAATTLAVLVLVAGCGGDPPSGESVVRAWAESVSAGDDEAAAALFAPGAEVVAGERRRVLRSEEEALAFAARMPCAPRVARIDDGGRDVRATFELADRPERPCREAGRTVEILFRVEDGAITLWHELPGRAGGGPVLA